MSAFDRRPVVAPLPPGLTRPTVGRFRRPAAQLKALDLPYRAMVAEWRGTNYWAPPELYNIGARRAIVLANPATGEPVGK